MLVIRLMPNHCFADWLRPVKIPAAACAGSIWKLRATKTKPNMRHTLKEATLSFAYYLIISRRKVVPGADSNHRHADFQSAALPTELSGPLALGAVPR